MLLTLSKTGIYISLVKLADSALPNVERIVSSAKTSGLCEEALTVTAPSFLKVKVPFSSISATESSSTANVTDLKVAAESAEAVNARDLSAVTNPSSKVSASEADSSPIVTDEAGTITLNLNTYLPAVTEALYSSL